MNIEVCSKIFSKIEEYDKVVICRHSRPDGDATGSTKGLQALLKAGFPEKDVRVINEDYADYTAFLGPEDEAVPDEWYKDALVIVCDTATTDRISNKKFSLGKELIKIDHHILTEDYGDLSWVEPERSSACEMIADLWRSFADKLPMTKEAATYLYAGMVTDSGRFYFDSTSGDTLRLAALLLEQGIDTDRLFANLYMDEFDYLKFKAYVYENMKITENGVAYIFVDRVMQEKFHLTTEEASNTISFLSDIRGSLIWLAFIEYPDSIRVRLRSRFVTVSELANRYRGGGHAKAAGATLYEKTEIDALLQEADTILKDYKASHDGWL